ncbi:MAG: phage tail tape measure C-terminal domain-containing protein [Henriciella sp.]|nr:phage tail tape measure C-terminal domain-containing protein [Henriciella sp.]
MDEFETELADASAALTTLVEGPGQAAADALGEAFGQAGLQIEQALNKAARSGELDFKGMTEAILADLARIAAEAVVAQSGLSQAGQTVNLNMSLGAGANADSVVGASGLIASTVALAAARGGRFL